jgi:hypothetical protein
LPRDICRVVNSETGIVLMVRHLEAGFQTVGFRVSNIRAVQERAEEEKGQDGQDSDAKLLELWPLKPRRG